MEPQNTDAPVKGSSKKIIIIVGIVIVLGVVGSFFSKRGDAILPAGMGGVDIDKNLDGSSTFTNKEGSVTVGGNSYPDNWPSDAPKYSGAQIQYSMSSNPQSGEAGTSVIFTTSDNAQKVVDFYKKELASQGWTVEQTAAMGQMTLLSAKKGESVFVAQITETGEGQTTVTIGIENK